MGPTPAFSYSGPTPGADSSTYNLLNTVTAGWPEKAMALFGVKRLAIDLHHDNAGTVKWYKSSDRGTNWRQMGQSSVAAPAATAGSLREILVEGQRDVKVDWVNGGSAQTTFLCDMTLCEDRAANLVVDASGFLQVAEQYMPVAEDNSAGVIKTEHRYSSTRITTATTTVIKASAGYISHIVFGKHVGTGIVTVYDNTSAAGTIIAVTTEGAALLSDPPLVAWYNTATTTGLTVVTSQAEDITVFWR